MQQTICGHHPPNRHDHNGNPKHDDKGHEGHGTGSETDTTTLKPLNDTDLRNSSSDDKSVHPDVSVHKRRKRSTDDDFEDFDIRKFKKN